MVKCSNAAFDPNRVAYCLDGTNGANIVTAECRGVIADLAEGCVANPFVEACETTLGTAAWATAKTNRTTFCQMDANGADETICNHIDVAIKACFANPFGTNCETVFGAVLWEAAKISRSAYCNNADNLFNTNCEGNQADRELRCSADLTIAADPKCAATVMRVCDETPFTAILCFGEGNTYDSARGQKCIDRANSVPTDEQCTTDEIKAVVCAITGNANPFDALICDGYEGINAIRQTVLNNCEDNSNANQACINTVTAIAGLVTTCVAGQIAFTDGCNYTQYHDKRVEFCGGNTNINFATACNETLDISCLGDGVAAGNPFRAECKTEQTNKAYEFARLAFCRVNPDDGNCGDYAAEFCRTNRSNPKCHQTIATACEVDGVPIIDINNIT